MLKKIRVQQLALGMYVEEFCSSWLEHPFWRSGFILTDKEDITRIRQSSISEVWIDCSKGLDVLPHQYSRSVSETQAEVDCELSLIAGDTRKPEKNLAHEEYAEAESLCTHSKQVVIGIFQDVRMGRAINVSGAQALVAEIIESVARNSHALVSLVRLKSMSEFTYMHSVAVCVLMVVLARRLDLSAEQLRTAGLGGLLHDLGKANLPLDVLHKPGKLSDSEFSIIKKHPEEGLRILRDSGIDEAVLDVCTNHHAKMDGSGYPHHIKGNEISLYSRMAAVCDVYDAVSSGRPYKSAWNPADAIRKMAEWTSSHLDPVVFHAFVKSIGIYPVGSLVRLTSGNLGVVIGQSNSSLLEPKIRVFFSTKRNTRIKPDLIDLSDPGQHERIEAREDPAKWNFPDLSSLWSGLKHLPG